MSPFDAASDADALALARAMLDGVAHPIVLLSADGQVHAMNRIAEGLAGDQQVVGKPLWDADWGSTDDGWRDRLRAAVGEAAAGVSTKLELRISGRDPGANPDQVQVAEVSLEP